MDEMRDFDTAVIASITTGVLLCDFSTMHEAAEYLMGHPIWTHQFGSKDLWEEMRRTVLAQCPVFPVEAPEVNKDNWPAFKAKIESEIGPKVKIRKGSGLTAMLPTDGIPDHLQGKTILVTPNAHQ